MSDQEAASQTATAVEAAVAENNNNNNNEEEVDKVVKSSAGAAKASAGGRVRGRDRRRVIHSDDDEEEESKDKAMKGNNDVAEGQDEAQKQKHKDGNEGEEEEEEEEDKPRRGTGRSKAAPASRIRASAPTAPPVAPPKIPAAFHVDPSINNNNNNNNISSGAGVSGESAGGGLGNEIHRVSAGPKVHFALPPQAASGYSVDMMYKTDFDALTYAEMLKIITAITPDQVENKLAEREQEVQLIRQQKQSQRVEHFLDFLTNSAVVAGNGNGYSNGDVSTTTAGTGVDNAINGTSSSYELDSTNELAKKVVNITGYTYNTMLSRLYTALDRSHEGSAMSERNKLPIPIIEKIGKKKTVISNFGRICKAFNREMEDVKDFIEKELSITGNLDSNNALILKYEIRKATDFDNILVKYLEEYVKCNACNRIDTTLIKEGRRTVLKCNWCTATRTVQAMGTATFRAALEKRSRQRATLTL